MYNYVWQWMLARLTVVIILQYIEISCTPKTNIMLYASFASIKKKRIAPRRNVHLINVL